MVSYAREVGGTLTFRSEQIAEINALLIDAINIFDSNADPMTTPEYIDFLSSNGGQRGEFVIGLAVPLYKKILSFITGQPAESVDAEVWSWIDGAVGVNGNSTNFGAFIQAYTVAQYQMRGGQEAAALLAQKASNEIGLNVASDIADNGTLPSIVGLGVIDAGRAARTVSKASREWTPRKGTMPLGPEPYCFRIFVARGLRTAVTTPIASSMIGSFQQALR